MARKCLGCGRVQDSLETGPFGSSSVMCACLGPSLPSEKMVAIRDQFRKSPDDKLRMASKQLPGRSPRRTARIRILGPSSATAEKVAVSLRAIGHSVGRVFHIATAAHLAVREKYRGSHPKLRVRSMGAFFIALLRRVKRSTCKLFRKDSS